jgi:glucose-6-phosphate isomerase/transaldolase/glucose-6-phosphate isomerase
VLLGDFQDTCSAVKEKALLLISEGHPVITVQIQDTYALGAQFVYWSCAVATAGHVLEVNPFDQPDVESTKVETERFLDQFRDTSLLPDLPILNRYDDVAIFGYEKGDSFSDIIKSFIAEVEQDNYIAIQAYLAPSPETTAALHTLQGQLQMLSGCATTSAYGPRYLHSTGQLHKGDGGTGHFIQITDEPAQLISIPRPVQSSNSDYSFDVLLAAQALGDWHALRRRNRHVLRIHLSHFTPEKLLSLLSVLL